MPSTMKDVLLILALVQAVPLAPPKPTLPALEWVEYTFHAGHVCTGPKAAPTGTCRSYAHTVIMVGPEDVTGEIVGGATYRLVGPGGSSLPMEGGPATFERHLVQSDGNTTKGPTLPKGSRAQMWNWGYDAVHQQRSSSSADLAAELPHEICITAWFRDTVSGDTNSLEEACIPMNVTWDPMGGTGTGAAVAPMATYFQPEISAAHVYCSTSAAGSPYSGRCRTNVHIVFKSQTGGAAINSMYGGASFSFDGGPYEEAGTTFYEQHIDIVNGTYYSAMQADYDRLTGGSGSVMAAAVGDGSAVDAEAAAAAALAALPKVVCFRVWTQDAVTTRRTVLSQLPGSGATSLPSGWINGTCLKLCRTLAAFHTPYCPAAA